MSKTRIVKGDIVKVVGGNYKLFSNENIENYGLKFIQVGNEQGVMYGDALPFPINERTEGSIRGSWISLKEEEIENAILGEEIKIKLFLDYAVGTNLTLVIKAKNDTEQIYYTRDEKPIEIPIIVPENKEFITKAIHLNPHHFYRKNQETKFLFYIKELVIYESKPLIFKGFGKPDIFKKDRTKSYMYKRLENGSSIAYVSGVRIDILTYQKWFEDDSEELAFSNEKQVTSYFENVYLTYLYRWSLEGEYGSEANRSKIIQAFEKAGKKHNVPPSILYTYACGEGMMYCYKKQKLDISKPISSFEAFGLDFFEKEVDNLKAKGYLDKSFNSSGKAIIDYIDFDKVILPIPFNGKYAITRYPDGKPMGRSESADNGKIVDVYPVYFKNLDAGIEGACALYARSFKYTATSANKVGWGNLTLNEHVFFGYLKIQKTSTLGNAEINLYRKKSNPNFLDEDYTTTSKDGGKISNKAYHRWVAWRYILLGKHFSS